MSGLTGSDAHIRRVWVTRTEPQASATAERLSAMGFEPVVAPVLDARAIAGAVIDLTGVDAIAFTSAHAVQAFAVLSAARDLPVFAVGETTAAAARSFGFAGVIASRGGASGLARTIAQAPRRPMLVFTPQALEPSADLAGLLAPHGVAVRAVAVYRTDAAGLAAIPPDIDALLIHSTKAARIIAGLVSPDQARRLKVFAISQAAAAPLRSLPFASLATAAFPDEAGLLNLLEG